jgi:hypothetical protein
MKTPTQRDAVARFAREPAVRVQAATRARDGMAVPSGRAGRHVARRALARAAAQRACNVVQ